MLIYHAPGNQFERFRGFCELISRFQFDFRRRGIFFERFEFLVCSKFNFMQRDCTCACAVACLHPHNSFSNVVVSLTIHDDFFVYRVFRLTGGFLKELLGGIFNFYLFPWVVCQILVRILQTLLLGVSSDSLVFYQPLRNLYYSYCLVAFFFLLSRAVTVFIMFFPIFSWILPILLLNRSYGDLQRISYRMGVCCFLWYE